MRSFGLFLLNLAKAIVGLFLFVGLMLGLIGLFFWATTEITGNSYYPRGAGWAMAIIGAAIAGFRLGWTFDGRSLTKMQLPMLRVTSMKLRLGLTFAVLWAALVVGVVFVFEPLGRYWYAEEWRKFLFVCCRRRCSSPQVHI